MTNHESDCPPPEDERLLSDEQLDRLLMSAEWPQPVAEAELRLQQVWTAAVREASEAGVRVQQVMAAEQSESLGLRERSHRRTVVWQLMAVCVLAIVAFAAGRWSSPVKDSTNSGRDVAVDGNPDSSADEIHGAELPDAISPDQMPPVPDDSQLIADGMKESGSGEAPPGLNANGLPQKDASAVDGPMFRPEDPIPDALKIDQEETGKLSAAERRKKQLEAVLACLGESDDQDVACCRELMARRREFEYLLWQVVESTTGQRQLSAITALGYVGSQQSVPGLLQAATNSELRVHSLRSLKRVADEQTLAAFIRQQQQPDLAQEFVEELISRTGPAAVQQYLQLVEDPASRQICLSVADKLSETQINVVASMMDAPRVADRVAAAVVIGQRTDKATHRKLVLLIERQPHRWEPIAALMWSGSEEAMKVLQQLQRNPEMVAVMQTASVQLNAFSANNL
ncbi:MAG: HEAT repeat domain-containing protein [Planctomycetaceae bacterium]|nr:HEAT repeat domain-containing protein [Planctomycetaceae bacterium]